MSLGVLLFAAWFLGVASVIAARLAWVAWTDRKQHLQIDAVVRDYAALVKAKPRLTEIERRRALKAFNAKHANAEVVKLTKQGPEAA